MNCFMEQTLPSFVIRDVYPHYFELIINNYTDNNNLFASPPHLSISYYITLWSCTLLGSVYGSHSVTPLHRLQTS